MWNKLMIIPFFCLVIYSTSASPNPLMRKGHSKMNQSATTITSQTKKQQNVHRVFFAYDKSDISEASADVLLDALEFLQDNENAKIVLVGHADNRGSHDYNLALGERRANSAKRFMINCTPSIEKRIKTLSKGESEPLVIPSNPKDEKAHAQNRRVEIIISGVKG
ncbi:OmpA family protein [Wolbachia endosymbiont of Pentidionis agamae]|uniref:OmpA family protein n=1 Tax=Wolbachia endosymbiont of Pentidionis agamae TaxID=3110435 RepID=UPI002FCEFADA